MLWASEFRVWGLGFRFQDFKFRREKKQRSGKAKKERHANEHTLRSIDGS